MRATVVSMADGREALIIEVLPGPIIVVDPYFVPEGDE